MDHLRQQPTYKPSKFSNIEKNQYEDAFTIKSKPITNQLDLNKNDLSNNFLFIYNSVTSVLRDRGII